MSKQYSLAIQIEEWTREAVTQWGDNWDQIAAHIRSRFAEMGDTDRSGLQAEAFMTLRGAGGIETDESLH